MAINTNLRREICVSEIQLSKNEMCCAIDTLDYMCHPRKTEFWPYQAVIDEIWNFHGIASNFRYLSQY